MRSYDFEAEPSISITGRSDGSHAKVDGLHM
jgi:hypothetical protein